MNTILFLKTVNPHVHSFILKIHSLFTQHVLSTFASEALPDSGGSKNFDITPPSRSLQSPTFKNIITASETSYLSCP